MTISEQIREAALYATSPTWEMPDEAFDEAALWRDSRGCPWSTVEGRTFLLLVAEALE